MDQILLENGFNLLQFYVVMKRFLCTPCSSLPCLHRWKCWQISNEYWYKKKRGLLDIVGKMSQKIKLLLKQLNIITMKILKKKFFIFMNFFFFLVRFFVFVPIFLVPYWSFHIHVHIKYIIFKGRVNCQIDPPSFSFKPYLRMC